jgi:hypothetical protein
MMNNVKFRILMSASAWFHDIKIIISDFHGRFLQFPVPFQLEQKVEKYKGVFFIITRYELSYRSDPNF